MDCGQCAGSHLPAMARGRNLACVVCSKSPDAGVRARIRIKNCREQAGWGKYSLRARALRRRVSLAAGRAGGFRQLLLQRRTPWGRRIFQYRVEVYGGYEDSPQPDDFAVRLHEAPTESDSPNPPQLERETAPRSISLAVAVAYEFRELIDPASGTLGRSSNERRLSPTLHRSDGADLLVAEAQAYASGP